MSRRGAEKSARGNSLQIATLGNEQADEAPLTDLEDPPSELPSREIEALRRNALAVELDAAL
jgi:hypothetical protein